MLSRLAPFIFLPLFLLACQDTGQQATMKTSTYDNKASASDTTVAGQDNDHDGVRDDVDTYINQTYPAGAERTLALHYATIIQVSLTATPQVQDAVKVANLVQERLNCFDTQYPIDWEARATMLRALTINNDMRLQAYAAYREKLNGQIIDFPETTCDSSK